MRQGGAMLANFPQIHTFGISAGFGQGDEPRWSVRRLFYPLLVRVFLSGEEYNKIRFHTESR